MIRHKDKSNMITTTGSAATVPQSNDWNSRTAESWIAAQAAMEAMLRPFSRALGACLGDTPATNILDVGCGTGATTFDIQNQLGPAGQCTGIDISEAMIAAAQTRAANEGSKARFLCADAQDYSFAGPRFDAVVSRFGVMFFGDPVAAFANLRRACADRAPLYMLAWRAAEENPFMTVAHDTALPLLPPEIAEQIRPTGQFAFASRNHVAGILAQAGWSDIAIEECNAACTFPIEELGMYAARMGPVGRLMPQLGASLQRTVIAAVQEAYAPYVDGDEVRFDAACWMISARS